MTGTPPPEGDGWGHIENGAPDGFRWGRLTVGRLMSLRRHPRDIGDWQVVRVRHEPDRGKGTTVDIYVSPTGRSVRVFKDHRELT